MKWIYILRHAKSSWEDSSLADFDRPLNGRGLTAARFIGEMMSERKLRPELIISSPAKRALQTATLVKEASGSAAPIRYDGRIYEAAISTLSLIVSEIDENVVSAIIVGHNPGMEGLVNFLTGVPEPMPTAALISISLNIQAWTELGPRCGTVQFSVRPREEMKARGQNDR